MWQNRCSGFKRKPMPYMFKRKEAEMKTLLGIFLLMVTILVLAIWMAQKEQFWKFMEGPVRNPWKASFFVALFMCILLANLLWGEIGKNPDAYINRGKPFKDRFVESEEAWYEAQKQIEEMGDAIEFLTKKEVIVEVEVPGAFNRGYLKRGGKWNTD